MPPTQTRARQLAAVTAVMAAGVLGLPSAASAAYTGAVNGTTVTLTGDDAADALTVGETGANLNHSPLAGFNSDIDFDSATPGDQTLPADGSITLVVNAGGGDDTVTIATANLAAGSTYDGQAGNDLITGNNAAENLRGGDGDDRLVGARGSDDFEGGAGNDTLVWNNGDGSDVMDGDAGNDGVEVNGAATQGDVFTIRPNGARVRFDRTNLIPFTLDIATERLEVNGLGGDDSMTGDPGTAALIAQTLNGGVGRDTLTGGDGGDLITGGEDADTLAGGAGDDRIVGDRGGDAMAGGAGDDTLVWNNGDGSDRMDGDDGVDRIEVNGANGQGDAFTVVPNGARAKFDRTNLVPFTLDVGAAEALDVRGAAGDDTLTVGAGVAGLLATTAAGGSGNDTLTGAEGDETFFGGGGNDVITGGGGRDLLDGEQGDDRLELRDGAEDLGRGGAGSDTAVADAVALDALTGVEAIDRAAGPPAPDVKGTAPSIVTSRSAVRLRGRRASTRIAVRCPADETGGCRGTLTLTGNVRVGGRKVTAVLGSARFALTPGRQRTLTVKLPNDLRRVVRGRRLNVRASVVSRDAAGNLSQRTRSVRLTLPRR